MNRKQLITLGLLGFVALSLTLAVADVAGWRRGVASPSLTPIGSDPETHDVGTSRSTTPTLTAIYFHAPYRCPTCKKIETYTHEALRPAIAKGQIGWRTADYTSPENADVVKKYDVLTSTVVLTETRSGQIVRFRNVEEVWEHTHDQAHFVAFMVDAWNGFRENL